MAVERRAEAVQEGDAAEPRSRQGDRFVAAALKKQAPGWPAPTPQTIEYLAGRGVMTLGVDGANMGPLPDLAVATHQAGGKRGMIWVESATNLASLPTAGAFFAILAAKHAGGSGGECRCVAVTDPAIARELIAGAKAKQVVDRSVTLDENLPVVWPGHAPGEEGGRHVGKVLNAFSAARGPFFAMTHLFDSQAGTHVLLPSFSLPSSREELAAAEPGIRDRVATFTAKHGPLGTATGRTETAPLEQMMGTAHLVDVRPLRGSITVAEGRPAGPRITREFLEQHAAKRPFQPGEVVLFHSGYSDERLRPLPAAPEKDSLFILPLEGRAEGWPAPTPEAIAWLVGQGIRCVGTDGPTLGGVERIESLEVDWMAASKGMAVVEFLTNLSALEGRQAFFLRAPIKIAGTRGGYGRALAVYRQR